MSTETRKPLPQLMCVSLFSAVVQPIFVSSCIVAVGQSYYCHISLQ